MRACGCSPGQREQQGCPPPVCLVCGFLPPALLRLLLLQRHAADEEDEAHDKQQGDHAGPVAAMQRRDGQQPQAPPHQYLAAVIWVARIVPDSCAPPSMSGFGTLAKSAAWCMYVSLSGKQQAGSTARTAGSARQSSRRGTRPVLMKRPLFARSCLKAYFWKSAVDSSRKPVAQRMLPMMSDAQSPVAAWAPVACHALRPPCRASTYACSSPLSPGLRALPFRMMTGESVTKTHTPWMSQ